MAKAYWIGHMTITDPDAYGRYREANAAAFARFGGCFLVRGGSQKVVEGKAHQRSVVIEFPNLDAALACYDSPEYQRAMAHRDGAAWLDLVIVEGVS